MPTPFELRCEYRLNPIGLDVEHPRFSWRVATEAKAAAQSAYRILVASSQDLLDRDEGDCWDSGRMDSSQSAGIAYAGKSLSSRQRAFWKVCIWDERNETLGFSQSARFEMALLQPADWRASWIGSPGGDLGGARYFRCAFTMAAAPVKARLYATGLGCHEVFLNGIRQGDAVLDPAYTDISRRILYNTHDAGAALRVGENVLAAVVGSGWHGVPMLLAQLEIEFADGSRQLVATNRGKQEPVWLVATGPVTMASIFDGESYDARLEKAGWELPGYRLDEPVERTGQWTQVFALRAPGGRLQAQALEPIRVVREMSAVTVSEPRPEIFVFDFGQNHAGWARLSVEGTRGTRLMLKYAEVLGADGTVNQENLRTAKATDTYILRGDGPEIWSPRFTYHGYRYVQVEGWPGRPTTAALTACVVRSDVAVRGEFQSSHLLLNRIHSLVRWTEESNLHGIPTDCPQRNERMGWLNDLAARTEELVCNFEATRLLEKFVDDIGDAQDPVTGAISDTVPFHWGRQPADPVSVCYLLIPWLLHVHTGDRQVLQRNYTGMRHWVDFLSAQAKDGILAYSHYGDWAPPEGEAVAGSVGSGAISARTPGALISTAFHFYSATLLARIATTLARTDDAAHYQALAACIQAAFHREFWREGEGGYGSGNQACNAIALYLELVPAPLRGRVVAALVRDVAKHNHHLTTGNLCTKYLLEVLSQEGHAAVAMAVATQADYPGWGYMLANGATTLWERWELRTGGGMNSHNHPMLGSVGSWLYRRVAGLALNEIRGGRAHFSISPPLVDGLTQATASLATVWGDASVAWQREDRKFSLEVLIPWNCTASVLLPDQSASRAVTSGRHVFVTDLVMETQPALS